VEDTNVVASGAPARSTCAPLTNPLPFTAIANAPAGTDGGAMPVSTGTGFCNVTALLPVAVASAELTARTVTLLELGTVIGAVYMPDELIVPVAALPPATLFTCQVTAVFDDPATVALNDFVARARTLALAGETVTVTLEPEGGVLELKGDELFVVPAQPASAAAASRNTKSSEFRKANSLNFTIKVPKTAPMRRIECIELCLGVSCGTTVLKDKIRLVPASRRRIALKYRIFKICSELSPLHLGGKLSSGRNCLALIDPLRETHLHRHKGPALLATMDGAPWSFLNQTATTRQQLFTNDEYDERIGQDLVVRRAVAVPCRDDKYIVRLRVHRHGPGACLRIDFL
jgi:hypothetical protein